ncbi:GntR family transcriptional regulator [Staphylococcus microti]|uniref:Gluconate operon transcriptional repressor n=1 Tax=Staphylococcus microti TaxID=569857 RepID=A0A0D6XRP6_9STAP|nr:GntR family transcriptional regulator [Staphylococcus microti]KIX90493.1 GntR family transcriptional regulator [Staphylococcus microti]PNZ83399.1 GntR family transcriptional regulator [Staphylococcus microti]SUM57956.1 gluconate operon transcriptional repressor [Staphylococcus microti]
MEFPKQWQQQMSKGEWIAACLRLNMMNGEYESQQVITENQIAKQFNVSRSPVRDAFKILSQDRLIQLERMGAEVLPFDETKQQEMTDMRLMIETFAFTKVIQREDLPSIVHAMYQALEMMKVSVKFKDPVSFTEHDIAFHELMVNACEHSYLTHLWMQMKPLMLCLVYIGMLRRMNEDIEDFNRIIHNHQKFVEAIEQKDRGLMYEAFRLNFSDLNNDIGAFWSDQAK